jgi:putative endonuclease
MTNRHRNVLYIGVTNNLRRRVSEHESGLDKGFSKNYNCNYLDYYEEFRSINIAIKREKELKSWVRSKKDALIESKNPQLHFLDNMLERQ